MSDTAAPAPPLPSRWDQNASFWVQIIRENRDKYRTELTDPAMLEAIGPSEGMAVLDAGCGEGYLSRILTGKGATVTGIDSSARLIDAARARDLTDALATSFDVGNVNDLPYENDAFDLVVCNHLVNDLRDPGKPIGEFARVLRPGGRLIILMLHPCFYNKHTERDQATNGLLASSYFDVRSIEQHFESTVSHARDQHSVVSAAGVLHRTAPQIWVHHQRADRAAPDTQPGEGGPVVEPGIHAAPFMLIVSRLMSPESA